MKSEKLEAQLFKVADKLRKNSEFKNQIKKEGQLNQRILDNLNQLDIDK